jgi:hypothetical protein
MQHHSPGTGHNRLNGTFSDAIVVVCADSGEGDGLLKVFKLGCEG